MAEWLTLISRYADDLSNAAWLKALFALCFTGVVALLRLDLPNVEALMTLMVFDYALGFAHAWKENKQDPYKFARGVTKFIVYGLAINVVVQADKGMGLESSLFSLRNLLCGYLIANEAISALTHLSAFGVPVPVWLFERLRKYRDNIEHPKDNDQGDHHDDRPL